MPNANIAKPLPFLTTARPLAWQIGATSHNKKAWYNLRFDKSEK